MTEYVYKTTTGEAARPVMYGFRPPYVTDARRADDPRPPDKRVGWELLATVAVGDRLHWTWRRPIVRVRRKKKT